VRDVEPERREQGVALVLGREDPLGDVPAAPRLGARVPGGPPVDREVDEERERRHPRRVERRDHAERCAVGEARLERIEEPRHPAHGAEGEDGERDAAQHGQDELEEVGDEDTPEPGERRVERGEDEEAERRLPLPDAEGHSDDLRHGGGDPADDDRVDREREVTRPEAAQERRGSARVADLGELRVGHHPRAAPEARVEHDGEHAAHHHAPPEPVPRDPVLDGEPRHGEWRVGGERSRDHRGPREPPGDRAAREEVLVGRGAGAPRVEERDRDGQDEVEHDDRPVDRGEGHGASPPSGSAACSPFRSIASSLAPNRSSARSASVN